MTTDRFHPRNKNLNNFDEIESTIPQPPFWPPLNTTEYNMFQFAYDLFMTLDDPYDTHLYADLVPSDDIPNHIRYDMMRLFDFDLFAAEHLPADELCDWHCRLIVCADVLTGSFSIDPWLSDYIPERTVKTEIRFASDESRLKNDLAMFHEFRSSLADLHAK